MLNKKELNKEKSQLMDSSHGIQIGPNKNKSREKHLLRKTAKMCRKK